MNRGKRTVAFQDYPAGARYVSFLNNLMIFVEKGQNKSLSLEQYKKDYIAIKLALENDKANMTKEDMMIVNFFFGLVAFPHSTKKLVRMPQYEHPLPYESPPPHDPPSPHALLHPEPRSKYDYTILQPGNILVQPIWMGWALGFDIKPDHIYTSILSRSALEELEQKYIRRYKRLFSSKRPEKYKIQVYYNNLLMTHLALRDFDPRARPWEAFYWRGQLMSNPIEIEASPYEIEASP